jgi:shikimate dehydrogenase
MEKVFGLIGAAVSHSFSKMYFDEKFFRDGLRDHHYNLYPLKDIKEIEDLIRDTPALTGLNVTLPYKEVVMKYLNEIDGEAREMGAVNVIRFAGGKRSGFNTDRPAFQETLSKWYPGPEGSNALILGNGGSSKAVQKALKNLGIPFKVVSREKGKADYTYESLKKKPDVLSGATLIINTTPLGMTPNTNSMPPINYDLIHKDQYLYDLIYNPARTLFLQKGEIRGAHIKNGLEMLNEQAERSWVIWNS